LNFGAYYDASPIIAYDGSRQPSYSMDSYTPSIDVSALLRAAREKGVPLKLLDLDAPDKASGYDGKLVLSRPDQHVAWRELAGGACPIDRSYPRRW
jgi:hypothetical protein